MRSQWWPLRLHCADGIALITSVCASVLECWVALGLEPNLQLVLVARGSIESPRTRAQRAPAGP